MKRKLLLTVLVSVLILGTLACGESKTGNNTKIKNSIKMEAKNGEGRKMMEEKAVENVYKKFYEYKINKNIKGLESILDKNFTLTHMTGYKQSREEWFSQIEDEQMKYYGYKVDSIKIEVDGDNAVLTGRSKTDARIYGSRNTWNLQLVMTMRRIDGNWIIMEAVASSY